jgi:sulfite exporter TauE/SafE
MQRFKTFTMVLYGGVLAAFASLNYLEGKIVLAAVGLGLLVTLILIQTFLHFKFHVAMKSEKQEIIRLMERY